MLAKSFCWGEQSQLHLSNSKQCLKSLTEGRCGCLLSAITMGLDSSQHKTLLQHWRSSRRQPLVWEECQLQEHRESDGCTAQRYKWLNKRRVQCSWHLQKRYPEKERDMMGPSDCIVLEEYLHNYRVPTRAAYGVRTTRCRWWFIHRFPIPLNGMQQGCASWHPTERQTLQATTAP